MVKIPQHIQIKGGILRNLLEDGVEDMSEGNKFDFEKYVSDEMNKLFVVEEQEENGSDDLGKINLMDDDLQKNISGDMEKLLVVEDAVEKFDAGVFDDGLDDEFKNFDLVEAHQIEHKRKKKTIMHINSKIVQHQKELKDIGKQF